MITFTLALFVLIAGYFIYGAYVDRIFAPTDRKTPAITMADGVDYIPLPTWKIFMIQFLNIAGLGPIFGAIMGAQFGTASYLWIVFGTIFAGAVHDFFSGTLSIRNGGESLPEIVGRYLGQRTKKVMTLFTMVLMILVGAVFVSGPAELIAGMTPEWMDAYFWIIVIFLYYVLATLMPVDKIIGKIYPLFAVALLFMAGGILVMLYVKCPALPEMWNGMGTKYETNPIFPMMFISIACGAISGFHATQSPLMARCMTHEKHCRPIFYGAMVAEGIVALIWAAAATYFFQENGIVDQLTGKAFSGAAVATYISKEWLGAVGGILAILGIVAAPITSGDTALRSARLIAADFLHIDQRPMSKRLLICIPLFLITIGVLVYSLSDAEGFKIIWRYFAWSNQTLSVFTLWAITVYLVRERKNFYITLLPALLMTLVCSTYICIAPEGLSLPGGLAYAIGGSCAVISLIWFIVWYRKITNIQTNSIHPLYYYQRKKDMKIQSFICIAILFFVVGNLAMCSKQSTSQTASVAQDTLEASTPEQALVKLLAGNERYVSGQCIHPHTDAHRVSETAPHQAPFAAVVGCSDSRVPVELVFDQGIGDIFVIRTAGNNVNSEMVMGSVDYAIEHLGVKVLLVLGHGSCGGVTGAISENNEEHGNIGNLLDVIRKDVPQYVGKSDSLDVAVRLHARKQVERITAYPHVAEKIQRGELIVKCAYYDVHTGKVTIECNS